MEPDDDPGLPIKLGPCGNGEFVPRPATDVVRETVRRSRAEASDIARRLGMSRRRFLHTLSASALVLLTLDACSRDRRRAVPSPETTGPGGTFAVPPSATTEPAAATSVLAGMEFVLDVQGHLLEAVTDPRTGQPTFNDFGLGFPFAACGEADGRACFDMEHFLEEIFLRSDTSMIVLSALPIVADPHPLSIEVMETTRRAAAALCREERVLLQGQVNPDIGPIEAVVDGMARLAADHPISAWKVYNHAPGPGWSFTDARGEAFLQAALDLGVPIVAVHKGLSGGHRRASPGDVGPAAARFPGIRFVVYHSGYEGDEPEGPFTPATADRGINRLIASMQSAGIGPNGNVYAELGTTWRSVMSDPTQAAHVLGKLLLHVGEDNVLWGTDSIWYGTPQDQIEAFRAFEITPEFQERFGYPALTPERKAKVLGLNAARLHGITPVTSACPFTREELRDVRAQVGRSFRTFGPSTPAAARAAIAAHFGAP